MSLAESALRLAAASHPATDRTWTGATPVLVLVGALVGAVLFILVGDYIVYRRDRRWWRQHAEQEKDHLASNPDHAGG